MTELQHERIVALEIELTNKETRIRELEAELKSAHAMNEYLNHCLNEARDKLQVWEKHVADAIVGPAP